MVKINVPYLQPRPGAGGKTLRYWVPHKRLRDQGWTVERLSDDTDTAVQEAQELNAKLKAWRHGEPVKAGADGPGAAVHGQGQRHSSIAVGPAETRQDMDPVVGGTVGLP